MYDQVTILGTRLITCSRDGTLSGVLWLALEHCIKKQEIWCLLLSNLPHVLAENTWDGTRAPVRRPAYKEEMRQRSLQRALARGQLIQYKKGEGGGCSGEQVRLKMWTSHVASSSSQKLHEPDAVVVGPYPANSLWPKFYCLKRHESQSVSLTSQCHEGTNNMSLARFRELETWTLV